MSHPTDPPGIKVLVIDDSNTIRRSAEIFLKQGGYHVLLADDINQSPRGGERG